MYDLMIGFIIGFAAAITLVNFYLFTKLFNILKTLPTNFTPVAMEKSKEYPQHPQHFIKHPNPKQDPNLLVPVLDPNQISRNLSKPPMPKGGFGKPADGI